MARAALRVRARDLDDRLQALAGGRSMSWRRPLLSGQGQPSPRPLLMGGAYSPSFLADSRMVVSSETHWPAAGFCATVVQLRSRMSIRPWPVASSSSSM
jgi:hypothetical protein